jgi:hypothetical protein
VYLRMQVDFDFFFFKSTLLNLPTYYLSLCPILRGVANRLEKL